MQTTKIDLPSTNGIHVELNNEKRHVVIKDFRITSNDVFDFFSRFSTGQQMEEELRRAIEIGVSVIQKVQLVSDTDYFEKRIEQLNSRFETNLEELQTSVLQMVEKSFDPAEAKSYTRQLNDFFSQQKRELQSAVKDAADKMSSEKGELEKLINNSFDADNKQSHLGKLVERIDSFETDIEQKFDPNVKTSITSKLNEKLEAIFADSGSLSKILDRHLSVINPESPLVKFKEEIKKEVSDLRLELAKNTQALQTREEVIQKSPEKGYEFEDYVYDLLQGLARIEGDIVSDVSKEQGETKRKSGDFTYDVSKLNKRIVIEARSRTITSVKSAITDLQSSKENRSAEYGIYLVENEDQLQKQIGIWNEYPDGSIITHAGLLEVAIKVAKARMALDQSDGVDLNINEVRVNLSKIIDSLKKLSTIKRQVTSIRGSSDEIETNATSLQTEIQTLAKMIEAELAKAAG